MNIIKKIILLGILLFPTFAFAQVCNTPNPTQMEMIQIIEICLPSTNANTISALALRQVLESMTSAVFSGGTGTVTSVGTATNQLTGGPITTNGTIGLATTAVTPGSYTSSNITVDAFGRLTSASNGSGGGIPGYVFITDFGAVCDGVTDDTTAINAAFATLAGKNGTVVFPANSNRCVVTSTIIVGDPTPGGPGSVINILGSGINSGINWRGANTGVAMEFEKNVFFVVQGIGIENNSPGGVGTTLGLALGGDGSGGGNQTVAGVFINLSVGFFNVGIQASYNFGDASEMLFDRLYLYNNNTGFTTVGFNSLDFNFNLPSLNGNGIGITSGVTDGYNIWGGSGTSNTIADFQVEQNGFAAIHGYRSEGAKRVVKGVSTAALYMTRCICNASASPDFISIGGTFQFLTLSDNSFNGGISLDQAPQTLTVTDNRLNVINATNNMPVTISASTNTVSISGHAYFHNNSYQTDPSISVLDFDGNIKEGVTNVGHNIILYEPSYTKVPTPQAQGITDAPQALGIDYIALSHVRQLSEASIPGALGDPVGIPTPGQNLRVTAKFATSSTASVTFKRTISVTSTDSDKLSSSSLFLPTDAGKPVSVLGKGNNSQTNWNGYIVSVTSSSVVNIQPASPQSGIAFGGSASAVIGLNEPDGSYLIGGYACDVPEALGFTSLTSSGFTATSSNASSTATCTILIIR